jgi:hypothetical protein
MNTLVFVDLSMLTDQLLLSRATAPRPYEATSLPMVTIGSSESVRPSPSSQVGRKLSTIVTPALSRTTNGDVG